MVLSNDPLFFPAYYYSPLKCLIGVDTTHTMNFTETLQMVPQFFYEMEADLEMVIDFVENHLERDMTPTELDELDTYLTTI